MKVFHNRDLFYVMPNNEDCDDPNYIVGANYVIEKKAIAVKIEQSTISSDMGEIVDGYVRAYFDDCFDDWQNDEGLSKEFNEIIRTLIPYVTEYFGIPDELPAEETF